MKSFRALRQIPFQVAVFCSVHWGLRGNHNLNRFRPKENTQYERGDFLRACVLLVRMFPPRDDSAKTKKNTPLSRGAMMIDF